MNQLKLFVHITPDNADVIFKMKYANEGYVTFVVADASGNLIDCDPRSATHLEITLTHKTALALKNLLPKKEKVTK